METITVHIASFNQAQQATKIYSECRDYFGFPDEGPRVANFIHTILASPHIHIALAYVGEAVAGYCLFTDSVSTAHMGPSLNLSDLFVKEEYRKRGIGPALLACFDSFAKDKGVRSAFLVTFEEAAIPFYEKFGWREEALQFLRKIY